MDNHIGPFSFVRMTQMPLGHKNTTEIESRAGVDGVFVWLNGKRGEPFEVVTFADAPTFNDANILIQQYEQTVGALANVTFGGIDQPKQVAILNVRPISDQVKAVVLGVGGLNTESYAIAMASWTLITTDIDFL